MLRLGLLSTARINREILSAAAATDRVAVVAVASRDAARAEAYAREEGIPRAHGSYEALLDDPGVDAVYIPLPNGPHHEWTMRALHAGKHVLCEKPYSRHPDDVDQAFATADQAGLVLTEAFMYRYHPQTRLVCELAADGVLGRLVAIRATFTFRLTTPGDVRWSPELDGGSLMDVGCYCVSGARLLAGEPLSVQGVGVPSETGVDRAFHGTLVFPDGIVAQIDSSFAAPRFQRLEARLEEATLVVEAPWRPDRGGSLLLRRADRLERLDPPGGSSFMLELEAFADAIAGRVAPILGRADALGQARAIDALARAAETGVSEAL